MRWKIVMTGLALALATTVGCKQQCFITEPDYDHYRAMGVAALEADPSPSIIPSQTDIAPPTTIFDPERKIRYVTLAEAIQSALEKGTTGVQSPFFPGAITDLLASFSGSSVVGSDSIRVLALQPAIVASNIEASLAKFDARWISSLTYTTTDTPVGTALQTFQARLNSVATIEQQQAALTSTILKPLPTGGVAGITFNTNYTLSNLAQRVNPAYQPNLNFTFEQPLLQGFGTEINQLRAAHPGSLLNPYPNQARVEGVVITRIRYDEQRAEFERNINFTLLNVEIAYWNLYGTFWTLYANEKAMQQAYEAWKINKLKYEAGRVAVQDFAQSRQQFEQFRAQRISALNDVLEKERQLRGFMGLPVEDGTRLVPADQPTLAPYHPDWATAVNEALSHRPELILARNDLKFRQLDLINQKNLTLPDLRFTSNYGWNGIGSRLDNGPNNPNNAFASLASGQFVNWGAGLQMTMPIGFRDANAAVRSARLAMAQSYAVLQDQENKAVRYLAFQYRQLFNTYELIRANRAQREAATTQLEARFKGFLAGRETLDILLESQRVWATALQAEFQQIVAYNSALANFNFAKGTIMQYENVAISEGPLPACVDARAVENERRRGAALKLREHPKQGPYTPRKYGTGTQELPGVFTPSSIDEMPLDRMLQRDETRPEDMDVLPMPRSGGSVLPPASMPTSAAPADKTGSPDRKVMGTTNATTTAAAPASPEPGTGNKNVPPPPPMPTKASSTLAPWQEAEPAGRH